MLISFALLIIAHCTCISKYQLIQIMCVSHSVVSDSATPGTVAHQAPLSIGLPSQEYWSGLPFPPPGDLPNPGIEPGCPALQADLLPSETPGKPIIPTSQGFCEG